MNLPFLTSIKAKELKQKVNKVKAEVRDLRDPIKMQKLHIGTNSVLISQLQKIEDRVSVLDPLKPSN